MAAPIGHTCPDIDKAINKLKYVIKDCENVEDDSTKRGMIWELEDVIDTLEDLRKSNGALRDWGTEMEDQAAKLENQVFELEETIKDLENERVS